MPGTASAIGRIKLISQPSRSGSGGNTATAMAFGDQTAPGSSSATASALSPLRAHGLRFWMGVGFVALALWTYHNLPE